MEFPSEPTLRAIVQRYARLMDQLGREIGARPMVLPTGEFFPDIVSPGQKGMERLVDRLRYHAGMQDIPVEVQVIEDAQATGSGGCCGGSCSGPAAGAEETERLVETGDGWRLVLRTSELGHEVALTTFLARTLARVFLLETLPEEQSIDPPAEVTTDLAAVALGFGTLVLQGSYMYRKSCGGPSVAKATALGCADLAVAFSLFVAQGGHPGRQAARHLDATQRTLFQQALAWIESNPRIVTLLKDRPAQLVSGSFSITEARPWLARVFGKRRTSREGPNGDDALAELEALAERAQPIARPKKGTLDPKHDDLRALVDEALDAPTPADES